MPNERTLEEAIALIRVLVAHSHEPLPRDLLEQASKFLEGFPYEPPPALPEGFTRYVDAALTADPANYKRAVEPSVKCSGCGAQWSGSMISNVPDLAVCATCGTTWRAQNQN